jgi:hypothetical protein
MKNAIEKVIDTNYEEISSFFAKGESDKLTPSQQHILERWRSVDEILRKFPRKSIAARKLKARYPNITERQALLDIDNACKFWNLHNYVDREFLNRWFIDRLLSEIANKYATQASRSKNLATLGRYIEAMPESSIDPHNFEKNDVYIQLNINSQTINLSEKDLMFFPKNVREGINKILYDNNEITEEIACEIIES